MSKKWKVFLTMEFEAEVEAYTEEEARDKLEDYIENGMPHYCDKEIERWGVKKWWGGANEVENEKRI